MRGNKMDDSLFNLLRLVFFFIFMSVSFKALMASRIEEMFKKNALWQIQLMTIFLSIIIGYLLSEALVSLMEMTYTLAGM